MLNAQKLGVAGGIIWGLCIFICTVISIYTGYASEFLTVMSGVYPGYFISWPGSFVGLVYGFVDGFIGFFLLGWLYNVL